MCYLGISWKDTALVQRSDIKQVTELFSWYLICVRVTGITLENRLTMSWGLGWTQEYSPMAVTGNQKLIPLIHYSHLHFRKAEINKLQISIKMCRSHLRRKMCASFRNMLYKIKSIMNCWPSGIRKERRRYCLSHPPWFYLMHYICKFLCVQNTNSNFCEGKKSKSNVSLVMIWRGPGCILHTCFQRWESTEEHSSTRIALI